MSKRLQVVVSDNEAREIQLVSQELHMSVSEWMRQALRKERREQPVTNAERKLQCVREACTNNYPTADIGKMLHDIERGRSGSGGA